MRKLMLIGVLLLSVTAFAQNKGGTLRVGLQSDIQALNPHKAIDTLSSAVMINVFENLVQFDDKSLRIVPALAESWESDPSFRTWTYTLRGGVRFHDGTSLDSDAVLKSFSEVTNFPHKVAAAGPNKVTFTLSIPNANFNQFLAEPYYAIVSPKMLQDRTAVAGTGPFVYKTWAKGKKITIVRNATYWGKPAALDGVDFLVYPSQGALIAALTKGEIDLASWFVQANLKSLQGNPNLQVESTIGNCTGYLALNTRKPPFDDVRVRKAVALALNPVTLTRMFFSGTAGAPATSLLPPTLFPHMSKMGINRPDEAAALLKSAGWDASKTYVLLETWAARPYMSDPHGIAVEVQKELGAVGIRVKIDQDPNNFFLRHEKGDFDLVLKGWIADSGDPVEFAAANLHSSAIGQNNASFWSNPAFDALLDACRILSGQALDQRLKEALALVDQEVPLVALFFGPQTAAWNKRVQNYHVHPSSQMILRNVSLSTP